MSIINAVAKMYERYPYPNYPLLAKPKWQEGYLASSQLSGRLLYDLTGCSPAVHEKRTRSDSVSILLAGSGEILPYIMRKWEPKHHSILSVDLSNANLKRARFRSIFKSNMGFLQADLQSYLDEQKINLKHFDHIDAYGVVHHMEHPGNVLKSFSQRIHPNGTIRMMVYNGEARRWIHDLQKAFKLLKLSRYSKVDLDIARKILRLLEFKSEKINGSDPNIATLIQDNAVNKKACCKLSFLSWSRLDNKNNVPNIIVIKDALINDEFNSPNIICIIIGNIMEIPSMICKIPSVKKTVL